MLHSDCTDAKIRKGEFIRAWTTNCPEAKTKKFIRDSGLIFLFFFFKLITLIFSSDTNLHPYI